MKNVSFSRWLATGGLYLLLFATYLQGVDSSNTVRAMACFIAAFATPIVFTLYTLSVMRYREYEIRRQLTWHDIIMCAFLMFVTMFRASLFISRPDVLTAVAVLYAFIYFFLWLLRVGMEKYNIRKQRRA